MSTSYFILTVVLLCCWCQNVTVTGMAVLEHNEAVPALIVPQVQPAKIHLGDEESSLPAKIVETEQKVPPQPQILPAKVHLGDEESSVPAKIVETERKIRPIPLPRLPPVETFTNDNAKETDSSVVHLLRKPVIAEEGSLNQSGNDDVKKTDLSAVDLVAIPAIVNDKPLEEPQILPAVTSIKTAKSEPTKVNKPSAGESDLEKNLKSCEHAMCPMIYCENSLPPLPTQGICCPRCVTNPKCNTSACPMYKCATHLVPANLTAGECCDHCAPITEPVNNKSTVGPKKTGKVKRTRSSSASSSASSEDDSSFEPKHDDNNYGEKSAGCNLRHFESKSERSHSRLIELLTEALAHFRHSHSHERHSDSSSSESEDDE